MDMVRSEVRKLAAEDYSTAQHLEHASQRRASATIRIFSSLTSMRTTTKVNPTRMCSNTSKVR